MLLGDSAVHASPRSRSEILMIGKIDKIKNRYLFLIGIGIIGQFLEKRFTLSLYELLVG